MTAKERLEGELLPVTAKEDTGIVQSGGFSERHGGLLDAFSRWSAL